MLLLDLGADKKDISPEGGYLPPPYSNTNVVLSQPRATRGLIPTVLEEEVDKATIYVYGSLGTIFCCCMSLGIIALSFSMLALNSAYRGDAKKTRKNLCLAKIFNIIAVIMGIVQLILCTMYIIRVVHEMQRLFAVFQPPPGARYNLPVDGTYSG